MERLSRPMLCCRANSRASRSEDEIINDGMETGGNAPSDCIVVRQELPATTQATAPASSALRHFCSCGQSPSRITAMEPAMELV
eukprot:1670181-Rhodomonas_salina.1